MPEIANALGCGIGELFGVINAERASDPFLQFLGTKEGVAIVEAMINIKTPALRQTVIELARQLART